tara:strand:+ start:132 stop:635 length:504 start_codon:yes stop_codon:yes gene_type:complete
MSLKSYGDINSITEVSLVIESKQFDYKFNGKIIDETVVVNIPKLQGLIESGDYVATLNVIADNDKYFRPYVGSVSFGEVGKVNVAEAKVSSVNSNIEVEIIHEEKKDDDDPCWDNYKQLGTKKKDGKEVPNCVPEDDKDKEKEDKETVNESKLPRDTSFSQFFDRTK